MHERSQRVSPDSRRSHLPDLSLPLSQPPHHAMPYRTSECVSSKKLSVVDNVLGWLANEVVHLSKLIPRSSPSSRPLIFQFLHCRRPPVSLLPRTLLRPTHGAPSSIQLNPSTHSKPTMEKSALVRTRRALRSAPKHLHLLISTLVLQAKSSQTPLVYIPLLSTAFDVLIRLKNIKDESLKQILPSVKVCTHHCCRLSLTWLRRASQSYIQLMFSCPKRQSLHTLPYVTSRILAIQLIVCRTHLVTLFVLLSAPMTFPPRSYRRWKKPFFVLQNTPSAVGHLPRASVACLTLSSHCRLFARLFTPSQRTDPKKLLTASLNSAKSSNPTVRTNASVLFKVMVSKFSSEFLKCAVSEILTLPLAGKTTGVDHRITLYMMLTMFPKDNAASVTLVNALPTLIVKETNDVAILLLVRTLPTHLNRLLAYNTPIPADVTTLVQGDEQCQAGYEARVRQRRRCRSVGSRRGV